MSMTTAEFAKALRLGMYVLYEDCWGAIEIEAEDGKAIDSELEESRCNCHYVADKSATYWPNNSSNEEDTDDIMR